MRAYTLTRMLLEPEAIIGKVVAADGTHLKAYSGRAMDNRLGGSGLDGGLHTPKAKTRESLDRVRDHIPGKARALTR